MKMNTISKMKNKSFMKSFKKISNCKRKLNVEKMTRNVKIRRKKKQKKLRKKLVKKCQISRQKKIKQKKFLWKFQFEFRKRHKIARK